MDMTHNGRYRSSVKTGSTVDIIQKGDQRSGKTTRGVVQEILTHSLFHPHGIKVRLRDGRIGRVTGIIRDEGTHG
ncbi:MAG: YwbE family protein [Methanoregula sp.]|nr:YwbE family protein [Methanoregula sp.]